MTSLEITRSKAWAIIGDHLAHLRDDGLMSLVTLILSESDSRFNIYKIVEDDEPNEDGRI